MLFTLRSNWLHIICKGKFVTNQKRTMATRNLFENVTDQELKELAPELPKGPLEEYRKRASFDWRRMKLVYDSVENIKLKNEMYDFFRKNPLFQHPNITPTLDETRKLATQRMYALHNEQFMTNEKIVMDPSIVAAETEATFMYDSALAIKMSLTFRMFANVIRGMGQPYHYEYIEQVESAKIAGCFALTEIAHGSNAKGMRTTATYHPETKEFTLHSDDFQAAKCWVGSLGKSATHAVVYAMLVTKGKNHGLHTFVVPLRDPFTMKPYPGVIVGDLGEKIGLNGVDNGFVMFNNYRLPFEAQLNKLGGVSDNGDYITPFKDPSKRFGASLGVLSSGRVHITNISGSYLQKAIVIGVRYAAVRRQFGPDDSTVETPIIEYQQTQIRVIPYLAAAYAIRIFTNWFCDAHATMTINNMAGIEKDVAAKGVEIHALSSAAKPVCGWTSRDGIQNVRETCGGHGYLKAAGIGDIRNDNDANCTYEGENSILVQQASNWLISLWPKRNSTEVWKTPYGSVEYLKDADALLASKCDIKTVDDVLNAESQLKTYKWLTSYMTKLTYEKVVDLKRQGKDSFESRNDSQTYFAVLLSIVYAEHYILSHFYKTTLSVKVTNIRNVLMKLLTLYGAWSLEKHLGTLYIGGYLVGKTGELFREAVLRRCSELVPEAVALVDTLAPPDYILHSVLGASDGEVYKNLQNNVMTYPGSMSRPDWWRDITNWQSYVKPKL